VPLLFAVTLFVSASLLFMVQPMVGKLVLPLLGGSPAVWNACMVFFQALLLLGYLYADRLTRQTDTRKQWYIHIGVLSLPVLVFVLAVMFSSRGTPIAVAESLAPTDGSSAILSVLAILTVAIGIPFFVCSTSATLLQKWFTYTGHPSARDPYFLYAASNLGSLISLLGYPIFIEPNMTQGAQTWFWAAGFVGLFGLIVVCGRAAVNPLGVPPAPKTTTKQPGAAPAPPAPAGEPPPSWGRMAKWTLLAFVPSSLMLGVTFHMTTDIASIPLLWVGPLSLYLITFIIAFATTPPWFRILIGNLAPVMILLLVFLMLSEVRPGVGVELLLYNLTFFAAAMMCHYELAHDRPAPQYLTTYFLIMSFGGVLGGIFNSLLAPMIFTLQYELHLALIVACFMVPKLVFEKDEPDPTAPQSAPPPPPSPRAEMKRKIGIALDIVVPVLVGLAFWQLQKMPKYDWYNKMLTSVSEAMPWKMTANTIYIILTYAVPVMVCFFFVDRPVRFALCVAAILLPAKIREGAGADVIHTERSFFGILKIERMNNYQTLNVRAKYEKITDETIAALRKASVPEPVLEKLHTIKDKNFPRELFLIELHKLLNSDELKQYESLIMRHTVTSQSQEPTSVKGADGRPLLVGRYEYRRLVHGTTLHGTQVGQHDRHILDDFQFLTAASPWDNLAVLGAVQNFDMRQEPLTYYHRTGPVGAMFAELTRRGKDTEHVAMVGLGTGSASCYAKKGQRLTFYEIDPAVRRLVEKPWKVMNEKELRERGCAPVTDPEVRQLVEQLKGVQILDQATYDEKVREYKEKLRAFNDDWRRYAEEAERRKAAGEDPGEAPQQPVGPPVAPDIGPFTFVDDARRRGAEIDFRMGDARLKLKHTDDKYALLLVDAFSSDSIPVHLLTNEAVGLYLDRLKDDGILALHISNKYVRLEPVVAAIAKHHNLEARVWNDDAEGQYGKTASSWVALARKREDLGPRLCSDLGDDVGQFGDAQLLSVIKELYPEVSGALERAPAKQKETVLEYLEKRTTDPRAQRYAALVRKYGLYATLMDVLRAETGYGFRPIRMLDGVDAWTDDYADVMRVMMIKELQAVRKFFGLPTPVER
jgi:hypothetical protein